jgi:hypothetical protein
MLFVSDSPGVMVPTVTRRASSESRDSSEHRESIAGRDSS